MFIQNQFDKIKVKVIKENYQNPQKTKSGKSLGLSFYIDEANDLIATFSGKICSSTCDFGSITFENYITLLDKLSQNEIIIYPFSFLNSTVLSFDVKRDLILNSPSCNYLSALREFLSVATRKNLLIDFYNEIGFNESILVKSSNKTTRDSLLIYSKLTEIYANRRKYPEYFKQFDAEFLEKNKYTIRLERRLASFKDMRKALHLEETRPVTVLDVLFSRVDLVQEKFNQLIQKGE